MRDNLDLDPLSAANDPYGAEKARYIERVRLREKQIQEYQSNYTAIFYDLWSNMSHESRAKVLEVQGFSLEERDPLDLWKAIILTYRGTGSEPIFDRLKAREAYNKLFQQNNESVAHFKERFENALDQLRAIGADLPSEADQAMDFINKLDNYRFARFKVELENDITAQRRPHGPENLTEAYRQVSKYKEVLYKQEFKFSRQGTNFHCSS
jgi:hypothetical protein